MGRCLTEDELVGVLPGVFATVAGIEPYTDRVFQVLVSRGGWGMDVRPGLWRATVGIVGLRCIDSIVERARGVGPGPEDLLNPEALRSGRGGTSPAKA